MKKKILSVFVILSLASACSMQKLNPFSESEKKVERQDSVNPFLWQAAQEKLSFMPIMQQDKDDGFIMTEWASQGKNKDEEFKFGVKISSADLAAESLKVVVYKRIKDGDEWIERNPDNRIVPRIEKAILLRARTLYRENFMKEKGYN